MAVVYLDTSALVKRYALETGSKWIMALTTAASGHDIFVSRLAGPEMIAAIFRKVKVKEVSRSKAAQIAQTFRSDWQTKYQILSVTSATADQAMQLAEVYGLRGYDAVHLATALVLQRVRLSAGFSNFTFVTADNDQLSAALAEGLPAENPNNYS
ncbi:MAG: type II toxin-antitoxin system VapC family toxin [Anaerolineae bacterium]|nr:type II toxin-antitoxin system VapC family toxin [Anaerolineae bacterium]